MAIILVYITHENLESAKKVVEQLMDKKLIACANYIPIKSCYFWKGDIENSDEFVSIVKTRKELWVKLKEEVEKVHPYDVPCIIKIDAEANEKYEEWIKMNTQISSSSK